MFNCEFNYYEIRRHKFLLHACKLNLIYIEHYKRKIMTIFRM